MKEESRPDSRVGSDDVTRNTEPARWRLGTKLAFRFVFVYFVLYTLYFPFHVLAFPPFIQISEMYNSIWSATVPWVAGHVLHLRHDFSLDYLNTAAGSKDTTYGYVQVLCYMAIAAVATVVWSVLDRRRGNYVWLHKWFITYLRLALAATMIPYGATKIFPQQFPPPSLTRLLQTYGESSPLGLMWTFMGASRIYSFFGGATELLAGMLLVIPRLATLGALICIGVMSNVLLLNLGYDIPVKLGSTHLVLMAVVIVMPALRRLTDFFVLNRRVEPAPEQPLFRNKWLNRFAIALQVAFGVVLLAYNLHNSERRVQEAMQARSSAPLYGIWSVDEFKIDGRVLQPLLTDPIRWQRIIVESSQDAAVQPMDGQVRHLYLHFSGHSKEFTLTTPFESNWIARFAYADPQPDLLVLTGRINDQPVSISLHKEDESKFLLNSRGFNWIQEYSLNR